MGAGVRVLLIDGEPEFVQAAREALETSTSTSFQVTVATAAGEGLERARQEHPDAIVLGYLGPRGTSSEVHEKLHSDPLTEDIPVLIVDVRPQDHTRKGWKRHEGLRMSAGDYTSRPVKAEELVSALERIIRMASGEPMGLREASEQMEKALARIDRIEELLVE